MSPDYQVVYPDYRANLVTTTQTHGEAHPGSRKVKQEVPRGQGASHRQCCRGAMPALLVPQA